MKNRNIDVDRSLFSIAFSVMRRSWLPCGVAAVLLLAANVGEGYLDAPLIIMIVGYSIYRTLLSDGRLAGLGAMATDEGRVPWRYNAVMLMILTPILILGIVWTAPGSSGGPSTMSEIVFGVVMVILYATGYVLLGMALPEIAERGDVSLTRAINRGRANFRRISRAMLLGPWIFRVCTTLLMICLALTGVTIDLFDSHDGTFQPAAVAPILLFTSGHVFAEALTAIVLVRAYRRFPAPAARP